MNFAGIFSVSIVRRTLYPSAILFVCKIENISSTKPKNYWQKIKTQNFFRFWFHSLFMFSFHFISFHWIDKEYCSREVCVGMWLMMRALSPTKLRENKKWLQYRSRTEQVSKRCDRTIERRSTTDEDRTHTHIAHAYEGHREIKWHKMCRQYIKKNNNMGTHALYLTYTQTQPHIHTHTYCTPLKINSQWRRSENEKNRSIATLLMFSRIDSHNVFCIRWQYCSTDAGKRAKLYNNSFAQSDALRVQCTVGTHTHNFLYQRSHCSTIYFVIHFFRTSTSVE